MKYLIEDYISDCERKVVAITDSLKNDMEEKESKRLITKRSVWRSVIVDLNRILDNSNNEENTELPNTH